MTAARLAGTGAPEAAEPTVRNHAQGGDAPAGAAGGPAFVAAPAEPAEARPAVLELFCRTGRLSAACLSEGLAAVAVGRQVARAAREAPLRQLDLTLPCDQQEVRRLAAAQHLVCLFVSPPCSRASGLLRGPAPGRRRRRGAAARPAPEVCDRAASVAHALGRFAFQLVLELAGRPSPPWWVLLHPAASRLWDLAEAESVLSLPAAVSVHCDLCMHGGSRPSTLRMVGTLAGLEQLQLRCDGAHRHGPALPGLAGGPGGTLGELPPALCQRLARLVRSAAGSRCRVAPLPPPAEASGSSVRAPSPPAPASGSQPPPPPPSGAPLAARWAAGAGRQHRRAHRGGPLVAEFKRVLTLEVRPPAKDAPAASSLSPPDELQFVLSWTRKLERPVELAGETLPAGTRLLSLQRVGAKGVIEGAGEAQAPTRGRLGPEKVVGKGEIYIGRGPAPCRSKWANPYPTSKFSRRQAISLFRDYLHRSSLMEDLGELAGLRLLCHCANHQECHADVLIAAFQARFVRDQEPAVAAVVKVGLPWSPAEFIGQARDLVHPFEQPPPLEDVTLQLIFDWATLGCEAIRSRRRAALDHYGRLAAELEPQEAALRARGDPHVQAILAGKRLLLFKRMLEDTGHPDGRLPEDMLEGFPLVGDLADSGAFPLLDQPSELAVEELLRSAPRAQSRLCAHAPDRDAAMAQAVWEGTLAQATEERPWLLGPLTPEEASERFGPRWVGARRFGVPQGPAGKVRLVDDFSELGPNSTVGLKEKLTLSGIDEVIAIARVWRMALESPTVRLVLSDGRTLSGPRHADWERPEDRGLWGKTWDLQDAYKQLPVRPEHRWAGLVAVPRPAGERASLWASLALPFGATSSVHAFCRCSVALRRVATALARVMCSCYLDDFPQVEPTRMADPQERIFGQLLDLLGWRTSSNPDKDRLLEAQFVALGVQLELPSGGPDPHFVVTNKPGRVEAIVEACSLALRSRRLSRAAAATLRGRLLWAEQQAFGCAARTATRALSRLAVCSREPADLGDDVVLALQWVRDELPKLRPRRVPLVFGRAPALVFTDGAVEGAAFDVVTVGALAFFPTGRVEAFGFTVAAEVRDGWQELGNRQTIGQAEIYPVLVAKWTWSCQLAGLPAFYFVDNDSARFACIKRHSDVPASMKLLYEISSIDLIIEGGSWYERVASSSNPADGPSRLDFSELPAFGASRVEPRLMPP